MPTSRTLSKLVVLHARMCAVGMALFAPTLSEAQSTDSLPFRKGQWGTEFSVGNFTSAGLLRFLSPRRALVADVAARLNRSNGNAGFLYVNDQLPFDFYGKTNQTLVRARLGHRWYRSVHPRIAQFATVGGLASRISTEVELGSQTSRSLHAGVFGGVGASWLVVPQLALGASWEASGSYVRNTITRSGGDASDSGYRLDLGAAVLRLNLFF